MDISEFFTGQGTDVFSEVSISSLADEDRSSALRFLPAARSVIVFGKEVPVPVYRMAPGEKTREMLRIAGSLDNTAVLLASRLAAEQVPARPVPLYLPVMIEGGKIQGVVRLKKIAAAGGLGSPGMNTVLLSPRFGPRLLLGGVVTGRPVPEPPKDGHPAEKTRTRPCRGCGRCITVCPGGALGPGGVDAFRCRTVSAWVPAGLVPAATWVIGQTWLLRCLAPLAPWIAKTATIRCSLCITGCPVFIGDEGKE